MWLFVRRYLSGPLTVDPMQIVSFLVTVEVEFRELFVVLFVYIFSILWFGNVYMIVSGRAESTCVASL